MVFSQHGKMSLACIAMTWWFSPAIVHQAILKHLKKFLFRFTAKHFPLKFHVQKQHNFFNGIHEAEF